MQFIIEIEYLSKTILIYLLLAMLRRHLLLLVMLLRSGSSGPGRLRIIGLCRNQHGKSKA